MEHEKSAFSTKNHFGKIEDGLVRTAIADKIALLHHKSEPIYDAETAVAQEPYAARIVELCAKAYDADATASHKEIWQQAKATAVKRALEYSILVDRPARPSTGYDDQKYTEKSHRANQKYLDQREKNRHKLALEHYYKTAVAMCAIDRATGTLGPNDEDPTDTLMLSVSKAVNWAQYNADTEWRANGTVVLAPSGDQPPAPVSNFVVQRIEDVTIRDTTESLKRAINLADEADNISEAIKDFALVINRGATLQPEVYNDFVKTIAESQHDTIGKLCLLLYMPNSYIKQIHTTGDSATIARLESIFSEYLQENPKPAQDEYMVTELLNSYLPGGLMGETAMQHPAAQQLRRRYDYDPRMMKDTVRKFLGNPNRLEATTEHDADVARSIRATIDVLLNNDSRAQQFADRHIRSITPRAKTRPDRFVYNEKSVRNDLEKLISHVSNIGVNEFLELHEHFDLGGADLLTQSDIMTLYYLHKGSLGTIDRVRETDSTLILLDTYGDYNGFSSTALAQAESVAPNTSRIVIPLVKPSDVDHAWDLLRDTDIKPSTLIYMAHGGNGHMTFNKGDEKFLVVGEDKPHPMEWDAWLTETPKVYINQSALRDFVRQRMQPPRFETTTAQTTKKRIVYATCHGDNGKRGKSRNHSKQASVAEVSAKALKGDDTLVIASENIANFTPTQRGAGLFMHGYKRGQEQGNGPEPNESNMVTLVTEGRGWVRRTPLNERVVL